MAKHCLYYVLTLYHVQGHSSTFTERVKETLGFGTHAERVPGVVRAVSVLFPQYFAVLGVFCLAGCQDMAIQGHKIKNGLSQCTVRVLGPFHMSLAKSPDISKVTR